MNNSGNLGHHSVYSQPNSIYVYLSLFSNSLLLEFLFLLPLTCLFSYMRRKEEGKLIAQSCSFIRQLLILMRGGAELKPWTQWVDNEQFASHINMAIKGQENSIDIGNETVLEIAAADMVLYHLWGESAGNCDRLQKLPQISTFPCVHTPFPCNSAVFFCYTLGLSHGAYFRATESRRTWHKPKLERSFHDWGGRLVPSATTTGTRSGWPSGRWETSGAEQSPVTALLVGKASWTSWLLITRYVSEPTQNHIHCPTETSLSHRPTDTLNVCLIF